MTHFIQAELRSYTEFGLFRSARTALLASFATVVFVFTPAVAQITQLGDATAPPVHGVGHNYEGMLNETVNPATGTLSIHIGIPVAPGRKFTIPIAFEYNSGQAWFLARRTTYATSCGNGGSCPHPAGYAVNSSAIGNLTWGGWSTTFPEMSSVSYQQWPYAPNGFGQSHPCTIYTAFMFKDAQGSSHQLNLTHLDPSYPASCYGMAPEADTANDTYYKANFPFLANPPQVGFTSAVGPDGTVYVFPQLNGYSSSSPYYALPSSIEDRNGNELNVSTSGNILSVTDSAGRNEITISGFGRTTTSSVTAAGQSYTLNWQSVTPTGMGITVTAHNWSGAYACGGIPNSVGATKPDTGTTLGANVIKTLSLPNGKQYTFAYDPITGFLSKITYPSGGYVSYIWGRNPNSTAIGFNDGNGDEGACAYSYDTPAITTRTVSFDGTTVALQQTFSYQTSWSFNTQYGVTGQWTAKSTTVTTQDLLAGTTSKAVYTYGYVAAPNAVSYQADNASGIVNQLAVESTIQHYGYSPAYPLLKTETKNWDTGLGSPAVLGCSLDTLDNGLVSGKYFSHGAGGQITDVKEYDYGQISSASTCSSSITPPSSPVPLRDTSTTYKSFANTPIFTSGPSIFNAPASVQTYDGSSGTLTLAAETDISYDETGVGPVSGLSTGTHDETNYQPSSTAPRANATTVTRKCLTSCSNAVTKYTYDETGQLLSSTDPCGNTTCGDMNGTTHTVNYSHNDSYTVLSGGQNTPYAPAGNTNAYLTKITDALGHTQSFTYDFNNGQLTASQDQNSQTTSYLYSDLFARPTQFSFPDGGQTTFAYNDNAPNPSVTASNLITSGVPKTVVTIADGMGHPLQTQLTTDPEGPDYTVTAYDGLGRAITTYNPTRCNPPTTNCGELTWGYSTDHYDSLGRVTSVAEQDGSTVGTTYSGNCTTTTDEAGNQRQSCNDSFGRLTKVVEDPAGKNYETDYTHDALNNLLTVSQKGSAPTDSTQWRARSFTYDSLSRLVCSANPELKIVTCPASASGPFPSGAMTYTYDVNGNVSSKISPSPNQPPTGTATVTTNYTYDVLNRITGKSYTDSYSSNPVTQPVKYGYDGVAITTCAAAKPPGDTDSYPNGHRTSMCDGSGGTNWIHDKMGRISQENRTIGTITGKHDTDVYNLDGSIASLTSLGYAVSYTYNGAGRPIYVTGGNTYVQNNSATYAPFGGLTGAKLGPTPIVITNAYNNRLQPLLVSAAASSSIMSLCYDFHTGSSISYGPCSFSANGGGDNGNVFQIVNNRDNNRTQNYFYDSLNRVSQAYSSGPNWGETFGPTATNPGTQPASSGIDAWGNLTNRSGVVGKSFYEGLSCTGDNQNRIGSCSLTYDPAGNVTNNASTGYTYDAENRLIATAGFSYIYDGDGKRVEKCTSSTPGICPTTGATGTLYWTAWGNEPLAETDLAGNVLENYVFFNGQRIARREPTPATVHFYFSDRLGTHSLVTDLQGDMPPQYESDFYPYGGEMPITSGDSNHYKFTSKERDVETCTTMCLDYFGARHYTSGFGRFMTPDWAERPTTVPYAKMGDPQTLNLYTYVENEPLNRIDADGHCGIDLDIKCEEDKTQRAAAANQVQSQSPQQQATHASISRLVNDVDTLTKPVQPLAKQIDKLPSVDVSASTTVGGVTKSTDGSTSVGGPTMAGASVNGSVTITKGSPTGELDIGVTKHTAITVTSVQTSDGKTHVGSVGVAVGVGWPPSPVNVSVPTDAIHNKSDDGPYGHYVPMD